MIIMKKKIFTLLVLAMMGGSALAGDKPVITVADVVALQGETVEFAVNLTDGKADTYTAMTLYAYFPTSGFTTTGDYTVSSAWKGVSCTVGDIDPGTGLATIPFASSNKIPGSAVDNLVTVAFKVDESTPTGVYIVTLKGTMFEYNSSDKDYADDVTFNVTVTDRITLDETSTVAPLAATGVNVTVKRTIKVGEWSTICLPFAIDASAMSTAFGAGNEVELGDFTGYTATEDGDGITGITVNFNKVTAIEANHPYLIKVKNAVSEINVDGVDIDPEDTPTKAAVKRTKKQWSEMIGTYVANTSVGNAEEDSWCLFLSDNKFWYSKGTAKMKAFRAYFDFYDVLTSVESSTAPIFISFDNNTTGINNIQRTAGDDRYYNLNGQHVENPRKGQIYIKNNKKVVVK